MPTTSITQPNIVPIQEVSESQNVTIVESESPKKKKRGSAASQASGNPKKYSEYLKRNL